MRLFNKNMADDGRGFMLQLGIFQIIGYILFLTASASVYLHNANIGQDTLMAGVFAWSWLLVAFAAGAIVAKWLTDPKVVVCIMVIAGLIWGFVVMA